MRLLIYYFRFKETPAAKRGFFLFFGRDPAGRAIRCIFMKVLINIVSMRMPYHPSRTYRQTQFNFHA
jgi:hypothetical protein